ncbi:hypothetical protein [Eubacterium barkeri]|uniref:Uncharacterized protein n=1 Tax=Eubacterium barkeri TaxID=1528 RepID=A0A1H3CYU6_EUBBA|nr:hypothetical protein [Eubacterium barkeri]SDX59200.1 hypothetical protein SAMN04488579_10426 [Eubacterium barkeri]
MSFLNKVVSGLFRFIVSGFEQNNQTIKNELKKQSKKDLSDSDRDCLDDYENKLDEFEYVTQDLRNRKKAFDEKHRN